ncbi:hypothetical protein EXU85_32030 [Spirosoma sp. KCTC 42546]|uniref:hypothetical protein n=1 Tax=Spirosoma sp. KCTC 42546 TaxID=2520506 RepID=UPI00115A96C6|nr:hypothetical protein [Spirosoma sp. KCTC 42546]QDK82989.1 hypothetical protein EXU85_32030 [Spirosoma sp. KCTC 42546]
MKQVVSKMEHDELVKYVVKVNNIICAEGEVCLPMISSPKEFLELCYTYYREWRFPDDYIGSIVLELEEMSLDERKNILRLYKDVLTYLLKGSSLSNRYFTPDLKEMGRRIFELSRRDVYLTLSKCDYLPSNLNLSSAYGIDERLMYLIRWKLYLDDCYREIVFLQKICRYKGTLKRTWEHRYSLYEDVLAWSLSRKKLNTLIRSLKKFFIRGTDLNDVLIILSSSSPGNIIWIGSTEALVYLFSLSEEKKFIGNRDWRAVLDNRLMFCSKQGNIITIKNLNATAYRLRKKEVKTPEFAYISKVLSEIK